MSKPIKLADTPSKLMHRTTTLVNGEPISDEKRRKIRAAILSGMHPNLGAIAKANGVSRDFIVRWMDSDPELKQSYENALASIGDAIEEAAVDMCLNEDINSIARQKMIEKMLPAFKPERYGENAALLNNAGKGVKRVALVLSMPVCNVDSNGIPIAKSESPLEDGTIEAQEV